MGCGPTSAAPKSTVTSAVLVQPKLSKVSFDGGESQVAIVSASVAASILLTHTDRDAVAVLDARPKEAFRRCHIQSAWNIDARQGPVDEHLQAAVKSRCALRTLIIYGDRESVMADPHVIAVLRLLHQADVRPKGTPLLLSGGISGLPKRFSRLLLSAANGQQTPQQKPLPVGPAEILEPDAARRGRPHALYLGNDRCVHGSDARTVLDALQIQTILNLSGQPCKPPGQQKVIDISEGGQDAEATQIARAQRAVEKLRREIGVCLLYGAGSDIAAAQYMLEVFASLQTADEALAYIRLRCPLPELTASAQEQLRAAAAGLRQPKVGRTPVVADTHQAKPPSGSLATREAKAITPVSEPEQCRVQKVWQDLHVRDPQNSLIALRTLRKVCQNILDHPKEMKYRRLKATNARVRQELLGHAEVVELFYSVGFIRDEDGDLVLPLTSSLQALRDLMSRLPVA